jgi:DNA-binding MarR family transcriptional regulator
MSRDCPIDEMERIEWFRNVDYHILQFYENHDIAFSPTVLAKNIDYQPSYVGKRLRKLAAADLIEQRADDLYELSDDGRAFIAGELSAAAVEDRNPNGDE